MMVKYKKPKKEPLPKVKGASGINWESKFLQGFVARLLMLLTIPHVAFWIPHWIQVASGTDIGWSLAGSPALPSLLLNFAYFLFTVALIMWVKANMDSFSRFPVKIISDQVTYEHVQIPIGGGHFLPSVIIKGTSTPAKGAHVITVSHGLGGCKENFFPFGIPMTLLGFAVVFYDARGHGQNTFGNKWDTGYIIKDYSKVLDFIEERARTVGDLDAKNVIAWGASLGGATTLNESYLEQERVKFVIGICTWADLQMTVTRKLKNRFEAIIKAGYEFMGFNLNPTNLQNRMVSPIYNSFNRRKGFFGHPIWWPVDNTYRVLLAHCKNDAVLNYENFEINKKFLGLPPENYVVFDDGNHAFAGMETSLVGKMLLWFWMRGY